MTAHSEVFLPVIKWLVGYRDLRTILLSLSGSPPCGQHLAHNTRRRDSGFGQG
jgi:hypothetical protein